MATVTFRLNGIETSADSSRTILEAARDNGVDIPTLCHDPRLPPYGSCLVCVVELRNNGRLVMSCATPVGEGMDIWTESEPAIKARRAALELLLSNHYADCRGPCFMECPASVDVQGYLAFARAGLYKEALALIRESNPLPSACGRVCVRYCEANCRRKDVDSPAAINFMKRYVADLAYDRLDKPEVPSTTGKKVAVVGGGPAGLTCAYYLRLRGHEVTLFDQQPKLGGMLRYGIPEYRLPEEVLDKEIAHLVGTGIQVRTGQRLGRDITLDGLKAGGYDAIFLGLGSWVAKGMGIEGEQHGHILPGIVFLEGVKRQGPPALGGTVAVVGGGNTAIDAARTALRCGASTVAILYRRTRNEMPADEIEVVDAVEEGVELHFLLAPKRAVVEDGVLKGLECARMELGEPDASGRRRPVEVPGSDFLFQADWIIGAIGQEQDLSGLENQDLGAIRLTRWKSIEADPETLQTSVEGVFTGGDAMTGPAAAIDAIGAGRRAARVMDGYLRTGVVEKFQAGFHSRRTALAPLDPSFFEQFEKIERAVMPKTDKDERGANWEEVDLGVDEAQVKCETARCLSCGCGSVFDCDLKVLSGNYDADQAHFRGRIRKQKPDARHPHILLDSAKCILCGRCVRYCGELIGVHALGFINRGYDTVVKPALDKPLAETSCIDCGNCIEVCPTGAITFKVPSDRPGPFRTVPAPSLCSFCGVGCELVVNHAGRGWSFVTAPEQAPHTEGELCQRGRFGTSLLDAPGRLAVCRLKGGAATDLDGATAALAQGLRAFQGAEILILASPRLSLEASWMLAALARQLGTSFLFAPEDLLRGATPMAPGGSTVSRQVLEDLAEGDLVVTLGSGALDASPVLGFQVHRALGRGAQLLHLGGGMPASLRSRKVRRLACPEGAEARLVAALCGALVRRLGEHDLAGLEGAGAFLTHPFPAAGPEVEAAAECFRPGKRVVIVANPEAGGQDPALAAWASDLALLVSGGLLLERADVNGQGFRTLLRAQGLGRGADLEQARQALAAGRIKALLALGTDLEALKGLLDPKALSFLALADLFVTPAQDAADVVVPLSALTEEAGTAVSFDGQARRFQPVFKPMAGFTTVDLLGGLLQACGDARPDAETLGGALAALEPAFREQERRFRLAPLSAEGGIQGEGGSASTLERRWRERRSC